MPSTPHLGQLPPQYRFVLNPYVDVRFSTCPGCGQPTKLRKLPFFIHVEPRIPVVLNKTHRYCPTCDLIILHRDELEAVLLRLFPDRDPETFHEQYLVMGTVERAAYRAALQTSPPVAETLAQTHDFAEVLTLHHEPGGWYKDEP